MSPPKSARLAWKIRVASSSWMWHLFSSTSAADFRRCFSQVDVWDVMGKGGSKNGIHIQLDVKETPTNTSFFSFFHVATPKDIQRLQVKSDHLNAKRGVSPVSAPSSTHRSWWHQSYPDAVTLQDPPCLSCKRDQQAMHTNNCDSASVISEQVVKRAVKGFNTFERKTWWVAKSLPTFN